MFCVVGLVLGSFAGCGGESHDRYIPAADQAREALEAALTAWKDGKPYQTIETTTPAVQPFDARWQAGKKLQQFEILEQLEAAGPKQFKVRMTVEGSEPGEEVTYHVLGNDPLNVFRDADLERAGGM
jgi:hypothetical protein